MIIKENEVLIFSDFHWGKSKDCQTMVKQQEIFIDWLIKIAKEKNIKTIIFMGDWFENRSTISVKTYNHSYDAVRKISDNGFNFIMILGNHDIYYKDSTSVNSVKPYSEIPNVHIIAEATEIQFQNSDAVGMLIPWETYNKDVLGKYDVMFGHFELVGAKHNAVGGSLSKSGYNGNDITETAPLTFSGHYHARKEYPFKHGKVICVGCPLQLDWGDYGDSKGVYIYNAFKNEYDFIENTVNANMIKVKYSDLKDKKIDILKKVKNNYVKLIVDVDYKFENVVKMINMINKLQPLKQCETVYEYVKSFSLLKETSSDEVVSKIQQTNYEHLKEFVNNEVDKEKMGDLKVEKLIEIATHYYERAREKGYE